MSILVSCPVCSNDVADTAESCVHCGVYLREESGFGFIFRWAVNLGIIGAIGFAIYALAKYFFS